MTLLATMTKREKKGRVLNSGRGDGDVMQTVGVQSRTPS